MVGDRSTTRTGICPLCGHPAIVADLDLGSAELGAIPQPPRIVCTTDENCANYQAPPRLIQ